MLFRSACALLVWFAATGLALADDAFFAVTIGDLTLASKLPQPEPNEVIFSRRNMQRREELRPYIVLDDAGEAYFESGLVGGGFVEPVSAKTRLVVRAPEKKAVAGRLFVPNEAGDGLEIIGFKLPANATDPDARRRFFSFKQDHFQRLMLRDIPGGAWFRHEAYLAGLELGQTVEDLPAGAPLNGRFSRSLSDTFDLLSGGRAVSESLQLDRQLGPVKQSEETVDITELKGIDVAGIDWSKLLAGADSTKLDPLASNIPADQHVVFFPSFSAFSQTIDESLAGGSLILRLAEPRSEDALIVQRYEKQLGLPMSSIARLLGPAVVKSVAITGSDPYLRTGTDVALLFETTDAQSLSTLIFTQVRTNVAKAKNVLSTDGNVGDISYRGVRSADRSVCSYVAAIGNATVVTNSPYQIKRLAETLQGTTPSIVTLPEYKFFRHRYPLDDPQETAFVFLSDETIRRWCGPRWRIGASRRLRDMAVMSEVQASYVDQLAQNKLQPGPVKTKLAMVSPGELRLLPSGVASSIYNTLAFQTPIAELTINKVTKDEADAYKTWRDDYQSNWRWAFDPIGLRLSLGARSVGADMTVMPLIFGSRYRELVSISQGASIKPGAGDPHDALVQYVMAINIESPTLRQANNMATMMAPGANLQPLSWLGETISLYLDNDPVWAEFAKIPSEEQGKFWQKNFSRLPLGIQFDVKSGLKLTAFLAGLRAFIEQTAPGMLNWESQTYREVPYVKVTPTERAREQMSSTDEISEDVAIYYAPGSVLVVTPNEALLKRALDRQLANKANTKKDANKTGSKEAARKKTEDPKSKSATVAASAKKTAADAQGANTPSGWLGQSLAAHVTSEGMRLLAQPLLDDYQLMMQQLAWSNLPILNVWHRLYPQMDPVELHERLWYARLTCPGGGKYVWNDKFQTMESTVYGHPGEPKNGPATPPILQKYAAADFGVTFENEGLRARMELQKSEPAKEAASGKAKKK